MLKSTFASSLIAIILFVGFVPYRSVATAGGFDSVALAAAEAAAQDDTDQEPQEAAQKKQGNSVGRTLGAPFRALSRLFGGSSNKTSAQSSSRKISEKEAATFESAKISRVRDARVVAPDAPSTPAVTNEPSDVHLQRGRELLSAGKVNEAIAELTAAESAAPKSAEIQNLLGVAYGSKGMNDRALKSFEAAVKADKNNTQYLNNYGFLLLQTNDFQAAVKYLKRAAKLSPNDARIWNNLGLTQSKREKFDDAYASFVRAVGEYNGHINIAAQLQQHGNAKDAIQHLEKAQAMRPNSIDVLSKLVSLYEMTGRHTDAETARRSVVALKTFADANK